MPKYPYIQLYVSDLKSESKEKNIELLNIEDFNINHNTCNDAEVIVFITEKNGFKYIKNRFSAEGVIVKATNRFIVHFPEHMNIKSDTVSFIDLPYLNPGRDNKIILQLQDFMIDSTTKKIFDLFYKKENKGNDFDIKVEILDMVNTPVETWTYKNCTVRKIDFGGSLGNESERRKVVELQLLVESFILN